MFRQAVSKLKDLLDLFKKNVDFTQIFLKFTPFYKKNIHLSNKNHATSNPQPPKRVINFIGLLLSVKAKYDIYF